MIEKMEKATASLTGESEEISSKVNRMSDELLRLQQVAPRTVEHGHMNLVSVKLSCGIFRFNRRPRILFAPLKLDFRIS